MACVKLYTIGHFSQGFLYRYPGTCTVTLMLVLTRRWTRNNDQYNTMKKAMQPVGFRNGPAKDTGATPGTTALRGTAEQAPAIFAVPRWFR